MRILHIIRSVAPEWGGPVEAILRQHEAEARAGLGVEREVVTLDPPDARWVARFPVPLHPLGTRSAAGRPGRLRRYGDPRAMARWIDENRSRFDCAVVEGLWNASAAAARMVLPSGTLPYFVFAHGMLDRWFRDAYPWKHRAKQLSFAFVEGPLLAGAEAVFFTAEEERRRAAGVFRTHAFRERVVDLGTGALDLSPGPANPAVETPYIVFLGRIHRKKGVDMLIEAMARIPADSRPRLAVVGPDEEHAVESLKARADALGVGDRIAWCGPVFGAGKASLLHRAEAFVLPSHQENFGIAVAEALSVGTPVLISDKVAIWREIAEDGAGLVEPDTVAGTVALLHRWAATSAPARSAMRERARRTFRARYDIDVTGPRLVETMRGLLAARAARTERSQKDLSYR